jgi:hypothetical protein
MGISSTEPLMYSNPFVYKAFDLMSMEELDPLPYTGVTFGRQVNLPGPWSGNLLLSDKGVKEQRYLESSRPSRTALFVDYLGTLIWGGMIWTRKYKETTRSWAVGAQEFGSYFQQRVQAADYSKTWETEAGESPLLIVQKILEDAQAKELELCGKYAAGKIGFTINSTVGEAPSIKVSYPATQLQTIESIVSTLSQMGLTAGFDYSFEVEYLPGTLTPAVTMNLWYPRQGRTAGETGIVIHTSDLTDNEYPEDGTKQANSVTVTGSGSGGLQPATVIATQALEEGYPLLEAMVSHTQINNESVLVNVAFGEARLRAWPVVTPNLILPVPLPDAKGKIDPTKFSFGSFSLGDDFIWCVDPVAGEGENRSPRWPGGMEYEWRINGWTCTADPGKPILTIDPGIPPTGPGWPAPAPIE